MGSTVTVTSHVPEPGGATAVILVSEMTVKLVAAVPQNETCVAPVKLAPAIWTVVPPARAPLPGDTPLTVGGPAFAV